LKIFTGFSFKKNNLCLGFFFFLQGSLFKQTKEARSLSKGKKHDSQLQLILVVANGNRTLWSYKFIQLLFLG
jgi:hypothetical protein